MGHCSSKCRFDWIFAAFYVIKNSIMACLGVNKMIFIDKQRLYKSIQAFSDMSSLLSEGKYSKYGSWESVCVCVLTQRQCDYVLHSSDKPLRTT